MERLGIFLLPPPLDEMLVHHRGTYRIPFAGTHLYTWVERGTARVLSPEENTMSPARVRTRTARSGGRRTNLEATAPLARFASPTFKAEETITYRSNNVPDRAVV